MFKALSDNFSSFLGGKSQGQSAAAATTTSSTSTSSDNGDSSGKETTNDDVKSHDVGEGGSEASGAGEENAAVKQQAKSPPPRPTPPLKSDSISKQGSLSESEKEPLKSAGDDKTSNETDTSNGVNSDKNGSNKIDKLDEVADKAREWGSYLFSMTKTAGASVSAKAKELKKAVAENTIIGDFVKEQDKFVSEKKEKARASEAAVPPWVGYNEEEQMKTQMLALSNDKRNFLRNPPTGVQFHFDYNTCYPVAMATLAEDDRLKDMRFQLVPKLVSEHDFWRNYFYRVSLIKQSTQLTSLAKQSTNTGSNNTTTDTIEKPPAVDSTVDTDGGKTIPSEAAAADIDAGTDEAELTVGTDEFISDAYNLEISDEDLMREMEALRASPGVDDQEWEAELQKELNDYEVVSGSNELDDEALEKEIMQEIKDTSTA